MATFPNEKMVTKMNDLRFLEKKKATLPQLKIQKNGDRGETSEQR